MVSKSFFEFIMIYRGLKRPDEQGQLADWAYNDPSFPKQSIDYDELSNYLEWNSPFPTALITFDDLWTMYELEVN